MYPKEVALCQTFRVDMNCHLQSALAIMKIVETSKTHNYCDDVN